MYDHHMSMIRSNVLWPNWSGWPDSHMKRAGDTFYQCCAVFDGGLCGAPATVFVTRVGSPEYLTVSTLCRECADAKMGGPHGWVQIDEPEFDAMLAIISTHAE